MDNWSTPKPGFDTKNPITPQYSKIGKNKFSFWTVGRDRFEYHIVHNQQNKIRVIKGTEANT